MVWLVHEGRKLGRVIHVKEGDDKNGPVVVTLEPSATITGRIVDPDGNPVSGATIRPGLKPGGDFSLGLPQVASGSDGRFTVPNVPIGCDYSLVAESGAMMHPAAGRIQGCRRPAGRNHGRRRHQIEGLTTSRGIRRSPTERPRRRARSAAPACACVYAHLPRTSTGGLLRMSPRSLTSPGLRTRFSKAIPANMPVPR